MPTHSYSALTAADAEAPAGTLKSTTPVDNHTPEPVAPGGKAPMPYLTIRMPESATVAGEVAPTRHAYVAEGMQAGTTARVERGYRSGDWCPGVSGCVL